MDAKLIAPCGINCSLCSGYQRKKAPCVGCNIAGDKPTYCLTCIIKNCPERNQDAAFFCNQCAQYPCRRLKQLEKRYRARYGVQIYENLRVIETEGLDAFIAREETKWKCDACGARLCMHNAQCPHCHTSNKYYISVH